MILTPSLILNNHSNRLAPAINSPLSLFFSVPTCFGVYPRVCLPVFLPGVGGPLCDHIVYALYKVNVLHIRLNELSALLDTVSSMLLFLYGLFETLLYFIASASQSLSELVRACPRVLLTWRATGEETPPWPITGGQSSPVEMLCKFFILSEDEGLNPNIEAQRKSRLLGNQ